jgi:hypothetical protein
MMTLKWRAEPFRRIRRHGKNRVNQGGPKIALGVRLRHEREIYACNRPVKIFVGECDSSRRQTPSAQLVAYLSSSKASLRFSLVLMFER